MADDILCRMSGIGDEFTDDHARPWIWAQTAALSTLGGKHLDLRFLTLADGMRRNIADLDTEQIGVVQQALKDSGLAVGQICTPWGKSYLVPGEHPEGKLRHIPRDELLATIDAGMERLAVFGAPFRIFPFYPLHGVSPQQYEDGAADLLVEIGKIAKRRGQRILIENEEGLILPRAAQLVQVVQQIGPQTAGIVWDGANSLLVEGDPKKVLADFQAAASCVNAIHLKDVRLMKGYRPADPTRPHDEDKITGFQPIGKGQARYPEVLRDWVGELPRIVRDGWTPSVHIEGHLLRGGKFGGRTGTKYGRLAWQQAVRVCTNAGLTLDFLPASALAGLFAAECQQPK